MKNVLLICAFAMVLFSSCKENTTVTESETANATTTTVATETKVEKKALVGKVETASFTVDGMSCEIMCASKIQKELAASEGVQSATVDFEKKLATVEYDAGVTSPEKLVEKVEAVNGGDSYKVSNMKSTADKA